MKKFRSMKSFFPLIFFALSGSISLTPALSWAVAPKKILMVLNEGYRPEEYFVPRKLFDKEGFQVEVAAHYEEDVHPSRKHIAEVPPIKVDVIFDRVSVKDYDAIVFVGGNGAWNKMLPIPSVHKILLDSIREEKITALICASTGLLATADNLDGLHPKFKGRHVTGYYEVEGLLTRVGQVNFEKGDAKKPFVVVDGKLITGRDPLSAELFGKTIVQMLSPQNP
jgi:protease I